jgi:hypothetical protein
MTPVTRDYLADPAMWVRIGIVFVFLVAIPVLCWVLDGAWKRHGSQKGSQDRSQEQARSEAMRRHPTGRDEFWRIARRIERGELAETELAINKLAIEKSNLAQRLREVRSVLLQGGASHEHVRKAAIKLLEEEL